MSRVAYARRRMSSFGSWFVARGPPDGGTWREQAFVTMSPRPGYRLSVPSAL